MSAIEALSKLKSVRQEFNRQLNDMPLWRRAIASPSAELHRLADELHSAIGVVSQYVEHGFKENKQMLLEELNPTEDEFMAAIKKYPALNHWNYWLK